MSHAAATYVRSAISAEVLDCYYLELLLSYVPLYAAWRRVCAFAEADATRASMRVGAVHNVRGERLDGCIPVGQSPCYRSWQDAIIKSDAFHPRNANGVVQDVDALATRAVPNDAAVLIEPLRYEYVIDDR